MNSLEHTDPDGDALAVTRAGDRGWVTATSGKDEVTVGPFSARALDAEPLGAYIRTGDLMDGGVTAAAIEKEAEEPAPSVDYHAMWWKAEREREKAEQERDEARAERDSTRGYAEELEDAIQSRDGVIKARTAERDEARARINDLVSVPAESRPLTPDAITDEMVGRASQAYFACTAGHYEDFRRAIVAALTEPPARPEGAEELGELIGTWTASEDIAPAQLPTGSLATLADFLAERGVRVVGEEQP